jgi:hypothetical protein
MEQFDNYVQELHTLIQAKSYPGMMIAGDFHSKVTAWRSHVNDCRGTSLLNMFPKNGIVPIRKNEDYIFCKTRRKSFLTLLVQTRD